MEYWPPGMTTQGTEIERPDVQEFAAGMSRDARTRFAAADIRDGLRLWRLAWSLGWMDIRLRYRGSVLGPFWLTISTGAMVVSLGVLYSTLFHMELREYLPYLALSQVLWTFLATLVGEACTVFTDAESVIRSVRMPFFLFATRVLVRNVLVLGHNTVVVAAAFAVLGVWPGAHALAVLPALPLWIADALALALLLGGVCARFRDIPPIVASVMQIAFFLTPVIWKPEQLGAAANWLWLNPFFDVLEIVRAPLLGQAAPLSVWAGAVAYSLALCAAAWVFFVRARGRIAFWI